MATSKNSRFPQLILFIQSTVFLYLLKKQWSNFKRLNVLFKYQIFLESSYFFNFSKKLKSFYFLIDTNFYRFFREYNLLTVFLLANIMEPLIMSSMLKSHLQRLRKMRRTLFLAFWELVQISNTWDNARPLKLK